MKQIYLLLTGLLLLTFGSCSNDDEYNEPQTNSEEIHFEMSFAGEDENKLKVATAIDFTSSWQDGDKIGVYIVKGNGGLLASGNYADNVEFTYNSGAWTTATPQYYPNDGTTLSFYAYYPYNAGMSNPNAYTFNVPTDQAFNNGEYYKKNDFLWAKRTNVTKSDNAVALQFSHALAMVEIAISDNANTNPSVNLFEAITDCTINLANQSITPGSTKKTIQMWQRHTSGSGNYTFFCWALVPPQTMNIRFAWKKNNIPYSVTPATNVTLTSGNVKKYKTTQP